MIKVNGHIVPKQFFPDGTQLFNTNSWDERLFRWGQLANNGASIKWFYENDQEMITLMYIVSHLRDRGAKDIDLFMPYLPNARMDRVKAATDVFTLKYFCNFINSWFSISRCNYC